MDRNSNYTENTGKKERNIFKIIIYADKSELGNQSMERNTLRTSSPHLLFEGLPNFFCKGADRTYFQLSFCHKCSALPCSGKVSQRICNGYGCALVKLHLWTLSFKFRVMKYSYFFIFFIQHVISTLSLRPPLPKLCSDMLYDASFGDIGLRIFKRIQFDMLCAHFRKDYEKARAVSILKGSTYVMIYVGKEKFGYGES